MYAIKNVNRNKLVKNGINNQVIVFVEKDAADDFAKNCRDDSYADKMQGKDGGFYYISVEYFPYQGEKVFFWAIKEGSK